jgi:hypothetical protein
MQGPKAMRSVQDIMREGTGIKVLSRKDVGEAFRAAKAKKMKLHSFWNRKLRNATKQHNVNA